MCAMPRLSSTRLALIALIGTLAPGTPSGTTSPSGSGSGSESGSGSGSMLIVAARYVTRATPLAGRSHCPAGPVCAATGAELARRVASAARAVSRSLGSHLPPMFRDVDGGVSAPSFRHPVLFPTRCHAQPAAAVAAVVEDRPIDRCVLATSLPGALEVPVSRSLGSQRADGASGRAAAASAFIPEYTDLYQDLDI